MHVDFLNKTIKLFIKETDNQVDYPLCEYQILQYLRGVISEIAPWLEPDNESISLQLEAANLQVDDASSFYNNPEEMFVDISEYPLVDHRVLLLSVLEINSKNS